MKKLPKKITPNNIKEAFVELIYYTEVEEELLLGKVSDILTEYKYVNPNKEIKISIDKDVLASLSIKQGIWTDEKEIRINISRNIIAFNIYQEYIGWDKYLAKIIDVLNKLSKGKIITEFKEQVSLRYISIHEEDVFKEMTNVKLNIPGIENLENVRIQKELNLNNDITATLTLNNKVPIRAEINKSIIDIIVAQKISSIKDINDIKKILELIHSKEKELFFSILKESYLKKLNPEY